MAGSNIKLGVDVTEFKRGMTDAQASVKTLDAAIKTNEKSMQLYGKSESYVTTQAGLLNQKLKEQEKIAQNAEKSLKALEENGVSKSSKAYQDMQRKMVEARGAMLDTTMELNNLATGEMEAAKGADQLANSIGGISKKISLDQVIGGINSITNAMERAAGKAIDLGKTIYNSIAGSAEWGDNALTLAYNLNMDVEDYQRYQKVFDQIGEITVSEWRRAKLKIQNAINDPTEEQTSIFSLLGISTHEMMPGKLGFVQGAARDFEDVLWDIGETLRQKVASGELTQDLADTYANSLFGKGFSDLNPLFALGREKFTEALENQNVVTAESVEKLATLNDELVKLTGDFDTLKNEVLAGLAPALTTGAEALDGLLTRLMEYLQRPEGQEMLEKLGTAVSGLFDELGNIDPEKVIEGFTGVFDKVISGLQWLDQNSATVVHAMEAIIKGWAGLKLTGGALEIMKLINGVQTFNGIDTGAPQNVTGGDGTVLANGTSGGGVWSKILNGATLFAAADAMYKATEGQIRKVVEEFKKNTAGMSEGDQLKYVFMTDFQMTSEEADEMINKLNTGTSGGHDIPLPVELEPEEDAAWKLAQEVGVVALPAELHILGGTRGIGSGGENLMRMLGETVDASYSYANGLPFVPYDGYLAQLHKGERVVPAREVSSRSFSSNLYVESMIMNNGTDAEGLAASMAAAQRRTMAGFGS